MSLAAALLFGKTALLFARKHWRAALAIAAVLVVLGLLAWYGHAAYSRGVTDTEAAGRGAIFDQLDERNQTNEAIRRMSPASKCKLTGGMLDHNGQCR